MIKTHNCKFNFSTSSSYDERAIVDVKLLNSVFRNFVPASLDIVKTTVKELIDNCKSLEEMSEVISEHVYITQIATQFHAEMNKSQNP